MDRDKRVARIVRGWHARQEWQGIGYGLDRDTLREMAMIAVTEEDGPEEWDLGETIPSGQRIVHDCRRVQWERGSHQEDDRDVWVAILADHELQDYVGTVYERPIEQATRSRTTRRPEQAPAPVRRTTQEWCPKCSNQGPHTVDEFTHEAVCADCENVWVEAAARCAAYHPEYGFTCCRVKGHRVHADQQETWHYDPVGHWFDGVGTSTADKPPAEEPAAPDQTATAVYLTVLGDAAAVLDSAQTTLNKVSDAYRHKRGFNAALCHTAESNSTLCDQASKTIKSLIKAKERKS
jgi:hypothetical protein